MGAMMEYISVRYFDYMRCALLKHPQRSRSRPKNGLESLFRVEPEVGRYISSWI